MKRYFIYSPLIILVAVLTGCTSPTPPPDTSQPANPWGMSWHLYTEQSIAEQDGRMTAGRMNSLIELSSDGILGASQFSGLWFIDKNTTISISHEWENPGMLSVVKARGEYYFAGGYRTDFYDSAALYVTDTSAATPVISRWHPIPLPGIGRISSMLYDTNRKMLFLATLNGVWYSAIPSTVGGSGYNFRKAVMPANAGASFRNIIFTANNMVLVSQNAFGLRNANSGVYYAAYSSGESGVTFTNSPLSGINPAAVSSIFLACCKANPAIVYAWASNYDNVHSEGLYQSTDGGIRFHKITVPASKVKDGPYTQYGFWRSFGDLELDGAVVVHNVDPAIVILTGTDGPFISLDSGRNFRALSAPGIHQDNRSSLLSTFHNNRLFQASDGGITFLDLDLRPEAINNPLPIHGTYNTKLANLTAYSYCGNWGAWGSLSTTGNGIIAMGTQDNSNVILNDANRPWSYVVSRGNDGGGNAFVQNGMLTADLNSPVKYIHDVFGNIATRQETIPLPNPSGTLALQGVFDCITGIAAPNAAGETLVATSGYLASDSICGIYVNSLLATSRLLFRCGYLTNEQTSAMLTDNGSAIWVGTRGGRIIKATASSDGTYSLTPSNLTFADGNSIAKLIFYDPAHVIAAMNRTGTGDILYQSALNNFISARGDLPPSMIYSIAADQEAHKVYVAMNDGVYATDNVTATSPHWIKVSTGLPTIPHSADLLIGKDWTGRKTLFLSTFGWSVWACNLT